MTATDAIIARSATKIFAQAGVVAFRELNLAVGEHETVCVVGPSGCGKTTFLRCVAGLTELTEGQLLLHGEPIRNVPEGVALVFQHFGVLPWKTVYDNAAFGLAMAGTPRSAIRDRVGHYLDLVGLRDFQRHYPYQLSGGMQQRVGLVRALATRPRVLLLESPSPRWTPRRARCSRRSYCGSCRPSTRRWSLSPTALTRRFCWATG